MPPKKFSEAEVKEHLAQAKGWSLVNGKLHRAFECKDFVTAFGNMDIASSLFPPSHRTSRTPLTREASEPATTPVASDT